MIRKKILIPFFTCGALPLFSGCGFNPTQTRLNLDSAVSAIAVIEPSPGLSLDFGSVASSASADLTVTLTNSGESEATALELDPDAATLSAPFSFVGGAYPGTGGTCAATLAVDASCTMILRFSPTSAGAQSSAFTLQYSNGIVTVPMEFTVSGTGV